MRFRIIDTNIDHAAALKKGDLHMVGFAEVGMSCFRSYLEFVFGYKLQDAIHLCEKINLADETATIYPQGYLTGLPARFFRSPLNLGNITAFRTCLRDAFIANRDYCMSQEMIFHYGCAIFNRDEIIDETIQMANQIHDDRYLKIVTFVEDTPTANTPLQRSLFEKAPGF